MRRPIIALFLLLALLLTLCACKDAMPEKQETLPETEETQKKQEITAPAEEIKRPVKEEKTPVTIEPPEKEAEEIIEEQPPAVEPEQEPEQTIPEPVQEMADETLVNVSDYIPDIAVELKYATADNFTGQVIYDFADAQLRYGTVKKLAAVQEALRELGYSLKIWDAYRPVCAQFALWEICPDPVYVANPNTGFSSHSRGNTVDVTLVYTDGSPVKMPTGFDDFSLMADRDYSDVTDPETVENVLLLETTMEEYGFAAYSGEWWHFSDSTSYPVIEN